MNTLVNENIKIITYTDFGCDLSSDLNKMDDLEDNWEDDYDCVYSQRINCWKDTLNICNAMTCPPKSVKVTISCNNQEMIKKYDKSNIMIFNMDTIDCALAFKTLNPLVLNLSDNLYAGGFVRSGSGAQEESLFRRTNYFRSLTQDFYPILSNEAIYSPSISVIKESENMAWKLLENNEMLNFIACPALKYPETTIDNHEHEIMLKNEDVEILKDKIKLIIQTAVDFNHDTIIFGAMGCGAWKNPSKHVAEIFKDVLKECDGVILNYYFAIIETKDDIDFDIDIDNHSNLDIFTSVFME
jgi:uncharacterized protein (TIGR02452 family)